MQVDWLRVAEAVDATPGAQKHETRTARELVALAHDTWFERDAQAFDIISVEEERLFQPSITTKPFKFVLDLHVRVRDASVLGKTVRVKNGDTLVVDWKTSGYNFSSSYGRDKFATSYRASAQWRYYMASLDPVPTFLYRGLSKEPKGGTYQFSLEPSSTHFDVLTNALDHTSRTIDNMVRDWPLGHWPLVLDSCQKYGRPCPHLAGCSRGEHPHLPVVVPPHLSFSSMQTFWTCPERWRRDRLEGVDKAEDGTEESRIGTATHAGLAALYLQLKEHQQR